MHALGERLRRERERRELSIDNVAELTKIPVRYLTAIEAGKLELLPGGFFRRSFVRQYGAAMGIESGSVDEELDRFVGSVEQLRELPPLTGAQAEFLVEPIPTGGSNERPRRPIALSIVLLVLALIACTAIYSLWEKTNGAEVSMRTAETTPPDRAATVSPGSDGQASREMPPAAEIPRAETPAQPPATDAAAAQKGPEPPPPPPKPGIMSLDLAASENTWVRLSSAGKTLFSGVLKAGDSRSFTDISAAKLQTGNAGGLQVKWNGKALGEIGPRGHIRVVEFTPESYLILSVPAAGAPHRRLGQTDQSGAGIAEPASVASVPLRAARAAGVP